MDDKKLAMRKTIITACPIPWPEKRALKKILFA
jgi:hypothetical protein